MGLFREFWESGKFALEAKRAEECAQRQKVSTELDAFLPDFGETGISESSKEILRQLRPKRGQETGRWLREISPRKNEPEAKPPVFSKADTIEDTVVWMDALFSQFADLSYEYNKSAAACQPSSGHANTMRLQISAIEIFRVRMSEAFEQYALNILPFSTEVLERPESEDLN